MKNAQETKREQINYSKAKERSRIQEEPLNADTLGKPTQWSSDSSARGDFLMLSQVTLSLFLIDSFQKLKDDN